MFLPPSYLVNLSLEASFEGLERGLEQLLERIFGQKNSLKSDDTYQLLWELGSNVLKYGTKSSAKLGSNKKNGKNLIASQNIDSAKICVQVFVCERFIQISLHYLVGKHLLSPNNNILPQFPQVPQMYALRYDELKSAQNLSRKNLIAKNSPAKKSLAKNPKSSNLACSNGLGNKVIAYLVDKICYDTPKIFLPNARERILRARLKH